MSEMTREEMDARLDAGVSKVETVEARISATLEEFSSDNKIFKKDVTSSLALMAAEIKHLPTTWTMISAIGASSVAVITIVLGVIAFGGDRFDGGVQVTSVSTQQAIEAQQLARENSEQIKALATRSEKNDVQIEAIYKALVGNGGGEVPGGQNE